MSNESKSCHLTAKQLEGYRQWLSELEDEARKSGDLKSCDGEIYDIFRPSSRTGRQVYKSYTDEELLDIVLKTQIETGCKLRLEQIYCIYKIYIRKRFGSMEQAKALAIIRRKNLRNERLWPPDWPERIDLDAFYQAARARNIEILESDRKMLDRLVRSAQRTGLPPVMTAAERERLKELGCGDGQKLFHQIGIPVLDKKAMDHMRQFWQRTRGANKLIKG